MREFLSKAFPLVPLSAPKDSFLEDSSTVFIHVEGPFLHDFPFGNESHIYPLSQHKRIAAIACLNIHSCVLKLYSAFVQAVFQQPERKDGCYRCCSEMQKPLGSKASFFPKS